MGKPVGVCGALLITLKAARWGKGLIGRDALSHIGGEGSRDLVPVDGREKAFGLSSFSSSSELLNLRRVPTRKVGDAGG